MHDLPKAEFAFPGPLRDTLVEAILSGAKTSTTGLEIDYQREPEPLPVVGRRCLVVDSADQPVAIIEITEVRIVRIGDIDLAHAIDEGEGYASVADWRDGHERFWHSDEYRDFLGDPEFVISDDTRAVAERFKVVERL
jgi:uncharacterized protein YhfF